MKNIISFSRQLTMATLFAILLFANSAVAQKVYTKNAKIIFFSKAPLESIEAVNKSVTAILDIKTAMLQFAAQMRAFEFEKALMQEHFNENYVESGKYPKATFTGIILENNKLTYTIDGTYNVSVRGNMELHGISKDIIVPGKIIVVKNVPQLMAVFNLALADFKITIPSLVEDKISKTVKVTVTCTLDNILNK